MRLLQVISEPRLGAQTACDQRKLRFSGSGQASARSPSRGEPPAPARPFLPVYTQTSERFSNTWHCEGCLSHTSSGGSEAARAGRSPPPPPQRSNKSDAGKRTDATSNSPSKEAAVAVPVLGWTLLKISRPPPNFAEAYPSRKRKGGGGEVCCPEGGTLHKGREG